MKTIEFTSKIKENKILIPPKKLLELTAGYDKNVRVVVFVEDSDTDNEKSYIQMTQRQFLKGYDNSDAIYDV